MARVLSDSIPDAASEEPLIREGAVAPAWESDSERILDSRDGVLRPEFRKEPGKKNIPERGFLRLPT